MTGLGAHGGFIVAAYVALVVILGGLALAILCDHRAQKRALDALEQRGAGRRRDRGAA